MHQVVPHAQSSAPVLPFLMDRHSPGPFYGLSGRASTWASTRNMTLNPIVTARQLRMKYQVAAGSWYQVEGNGRHVIVGDCCQGVSRCYVSLDHSCSQSISCPLGSNDKTVLAASKDYTYIQFIKDVKQEVRKVQISDGSSSGFLEVTKRWAHYVVTGIHQGKGFLRQDGVNMVYKSTAITTRLVACFQSSKLLHSCSITPKTRTDAVFVQKKIAFMWKGWRVGFGFFLAMSATVSKDVDFYPGIGLRFQALFKAYLETGTEGRD